jgi:hypothetical protein
MPILDLFWSMLWFFMFVLWIWLVISIFIDIFRSEDLSGWGKAGWTILVLVIPLLGVLIYLVARGSSMQQRRVDDATAQKTATDDYIRSAAQTSTADQLTQLSQLRDQGALSEAEFNSQKQKLLA